MPALFIHAAAAAAAEAVVVDVRRCCCGRLERERDIFVFQSCPEEDRWVRAKTERLGPVDAAVSSDLVSTRMPSTATSSPKCAEIHSYRHVWVCQAAAASAAAAGFVFSNAFPAFADGPYSLPDLPYPYEALEPYIDAATMKVCFGESAYICRRFTALWCDVIQYGTETPPTTFTLNA